MLPKLPARNRSEKIQTEILELEAKIGASIFGPISKHQDRSFFCLNRHTWVWHEQWIDENKKSKSLMTYYHIRSNGIFKSFGNQSYQLLSNEELDNFIKATKQYAEIVPQKLANQYLS